MGIKWEHQHKYTEQSNMAGLNGLIRSGVETGDLAVSLSITQGDNKFKLRVINRHFTNDS